MVFSFFTPPSAFGAHDAASHARKLAKTLTCRGPAAGAAGAVETTPIFLKDGRKVLVAVVAVVDAVDIDAVFKPEGLPRYEERAFFGTAASESVLGVSLAVEVAAVAAPMAFEDWRRNMETIGCDGIPGVGVNASAGLSSLLSSTGLGIP